MTIRLSILTVLFWISIIGCKKSGTPSSNNLDVYSTLTFKSDQLGVAESISATAVWPWYFSKEADADDGDVLSLKFRSPVDKKTYAGFLIESSNGVSLKLGNNTKCTLTIVSGWKTYSCFDLNVNITKFPTVENDFCEGSFSGDITFTDLSNPPKVITQKSFCNGTFKTPLKNR